MSTQAYSAHSITQYLLGSLPEAETERLDELSITDDEFAEALRAAEHDLVDAYAQGELSGSALAQFESHYMASPARRERVRFAQALQARSQSPETAVPEPPGARDSSGPSTPLNRETFRPAPLASRTAPDWLQWAFAAAALLLLVAGGWLAVDNVSLRRQLTQARAARQDLGQREQPLDARTAPAPGDAGRSDGGRSSGGVDRPGAAPATDRPPARDDRGLTVASFVLTPQMRSAGRPPTLHLAATVEEVALRLELEPVAYPAYRVALVNPSNDRTLWRSDLVKASRSRGGDAVSVRIPAGRLAAGPLVLRVSGVPSRGVPEIVGDYPFTVVR